MKFYRHYKNKPYKYIGVAKHSETLEDLVIYECLYDNPSARLWVRPKEMFFENVDVKGQAVPRFAKVPITLETSTELTERHIHAVLSLAEKGLGDCDPAWFRSRLENHSRFHLVLAFIDEQPVGFKLGHGEDRFCFYSWLGTVLPEFRGLGIATALMTAQHEWCRKQGYTKVRTKTRNQFREMMILNLKAGFEVVGTMTTKVVEILMEKQLV